MMGSSLLLVVACGQCIGGRWQFCSPAPGKNTKGAIKAPSKRIVACPGDHIVIGDRNGLLRIELLVKRAKLRIAEESDASAMLRTWKTYVRVRSRCLGRGEGFAVPEQLSQIPPVNTAAE